MQMLSAKSAATLIADKAFTLAFPPDGDWADVSGWQVSPHYGVPPEFDLEIWSNGPVVNLTAAELFGGSLHPFAIDDVAVDDDAGNPDIDTATNELAVTGHPYLNGDGPLHTASSGTLSAGLSATVDYWVIVVDANTIKLATSLSDAMAGTEVDITAAGTGTLTLSDVEPDDTTEGTMRLHWHSEGLLGVAGDGAVALTDQKAYRERRSHRPRALFYVLVATLDNSDPEWVSAAVYPVQDA